MITPNLRHRSDSERSLPQPQEKLLELAFAGNDNEPMLCRKPG